MKNPWHWEKSFDGFNTAERRIHDVLQQTREDLLAGQKAADASGERIAKNVKDASAQLEKMAAASAVTAQRVSSDIRDGMATIAYQIAKLGGKIDALGELIDVRLVELIQAVDNGFGRAVSQLAAVSEQLGKIIKLLQNPQEVKCAEFTRSGVLLFYHAEWADANRSFERAIAEYEYSSIPWLYLGKSAFYIDGDLRLADERFMNAAKFGKLKQDDYAHAADALIERANIAFLNGDKSQCADFARQAVDLRRIDAAILVHAARCFIAANEVQAAGRSIVAAFDLEPRTVLALAFPWSQPIRSYASQWLKETHKKELAILNSLDAEFESINDAVQSADLKGSAWENFQAAKNLLTQMSRGFLDLRVELRRYTSLLNQASQSISTEMHSRIKASYETYEHYKYGDHARIETIALVVGVCILVPAVLFLPIVYPGAPHQILGWFPFGQLVWWLVWASLVLMVGGLCFGPANYAPEITVGRTVVSIVLGSISWLAIGWLRKIGVPPEPIFWPGLLLILSSLIWLVVEKQRRRFEALRVKEVLDPLISRLLELGSRGVMVAEAAVTRNIRERLNAARYSFSLKNQVRFLEKKVLSMLNLGQDRALKSIFDWERR